MTLVFALPLDAAGWRWGDDIRRQRPIQGPGEFANQVAVRCGATGTMSLYPLAAVWNEQRDWRWPWTWPSRRNIAWAITPGRQLFIAYDFGLVKETERFPGSADFRFVIYRFDPALGVPRRLAEISWRFSRTTSRCARRTRASGCRSPTSAQCRAGRTSGSGSTRATTTCPWDDAHGVLSFRYTEPMTWWMPMKKEVPRTLAEALRVRDELARRIQPQHRRMAEVAARRHVRRGGQPPAVPQRALVQRRGLEPEPESLAERSRQSGARRFP